MIERATAAREAGDWRGACAVSDVDITFDLPELVREHGSEVVDELLDDLRYFAPDLVRWHLPRVLGGRSTLSTDHTFLLASYGSDSAGSVSGHGPYLMVRTPKMVDGPQQLRLAFGRAPKTGGTRRQWWTTSRHLWQANHAGKLRQRCGGDDRTPFFHRDGTPLAPAELPTGPCPDDVAGRTEWLVGCFEAAAGDADRYVEAFAAAGIAFDPSMPDLDDWQLRGTQFVAMLAQRPLALSQLVPHLAALGVHGERWVIPFDWRLHLAFDVSDPSAIRAKAESAYRPYGDRSKVRAAEHIPESSWRRLPDLDLVRAGRITPDELHPLVRSALFPDRPAPDGPVGPRDPQPPAPVRVRCGGEWHEYRASGARFALSHTPEEEQREQALVAFGGSTSGCFAVRQAWAGGDGRLPRKLRAQRQDLFHRVQHGDTDGVVALLDAGMDPAARDGRRRTLLHHVNKLDHDVLLPRLLAAGLDLEARDHHQRTPLHVAVGDRGSESLVRALLAAGAATDVVDETEWTLRDLIRRHKRTDLTFLFEALADLADRDNYDWLDEYQEEEDDEDDE